MKPIGSEGCLFEFLSTFVYWAVAVSLRFRTAEVESGGMCTVGVF